MENENLEPIGEVKLSRQKYEECEWVFQFDEDEPQIFAWTGEHTLNNEEPTITITIGNTKNANISFTNQISNKRFKIFARELSEEGKILRAREAKESELVKENLENGSEN